MTNCFPPDPENMNNDRAEWAGAAVRHFQSTTGTDFEDALCDLLCDLIHWSDRNNIVFDNELYRARTHYEQETALLATDRQLYRVTYIITREESYEIEAASAEEAEDMAFSDGELIDTGETTNVECWGIQQVGARRPPYRHDVWPKKGGTQ